MAQLSCTRARTHRQTDTHGEKCIHASYRRDILEAFFPVCSALCASWCSCTAVTLCAEGRVCAHGHTQARTSAHMRMCARRKYKWRKITVMDTFTPPSPLLAQNWWQTVECNANVFLFACNTPLHKKGKKKKRYLKNKIAELSIWLTGLSTSSQWADSFSSLGWRWSHFLNTTIVTEWTSSGLM